MDAGEWAIIWLVVTAACVIGEVLTAGTFFALPFAIGGLVAMLVTLGTDHVLAGWITFLAVSTLSFMGLRRFSRRLDERIPTEGIGANRLLGQSALVLEAIEGGQRDGLVRIDREEWRAEADVGVTLAVGARTRVVEVRGTRVVVEPEG